MLTYVTAYLYDEGDDPNLIAGEEWSIQQLITLSKIGIPLVIFVLSSYETTIRQFIDQTNIVIYPIQKTDLWTYQVVCSGSFATPLHCDANKDTFAHLWRTHTCVELVNRAVDKNPFGSTHFAWINYSTPYLFSKRAETEEFLRVLSRYQFVQEMLVMPGFTPTHCENVLDGIQWRFCGGFFIGDGKSLAKWYRFYVDAFPAFLRKYNTLVWEVNFWAYIEQNGWAVSWYSANHSDSLITNLTLSCYTLCLAEREGYQSIVYDYPKIPGFHPTSTSYIKRRKDGRRYVNVRYVNYWLFPNGYYGYSSDEHIIENINVVCEIDGSWRPKMPTSFRTMVENTGLSRFSGTYSRGLEDIRIYESAEGGIKCIATNMNYSAGGRNRMVVGDYCVDTCEIKNGRILQPPVESYCEKNWIPIGDGMFIYQWSPFQIGRLDESGRLRIVIEHKIVAPQFHRVRGSSIFTRVEGEGYLGVVHFSEEGSPRHYFHMMVLLDSVSFLPKKYSQPFCFQTLGIEFCIGFTVEGGEYIFWISRMDRDPMVIKIPAFPLSFDF